MSNEQPSTLARYLFVAYALLVVYASLHPFSGWRDQGVPQFAFLTARFPRPYLPFDLAANLLGYMPLGFLAVLAAHPILRGRAAFAFAVLCALALSLALESLQLYLPTRTSSNLDLFANTAGGIIGALAAAAASRRLLVFFLVGAGLAVHSFAFGLLVSSQDILSWLTPGALYGVAAALLLLSIAADLPRAVQLAISGLALLAATALVNLAPANPYMTATLSLWQQGQYFNFNGATRVVSAIWPFAAMFYLVLLAAGRVQAEE